MSLHLESLDRIRSAVKNVYGLSNLDQWITKYTYLNDEPFSFKDHEFQIPILKDPSRTSIVVKCAQVGLSELSYRWAVAACCAIENFTCIYTFPTATDAEDNNRTRIDPMIAGSPRVKLLVNPDMNNSSMKQFGKNSFLFFRGTRSATQALSTPADGIINDEFDKSDQETVTVYISRLQHKPHKIRKIFSTPTIEKFGISKEAETARRHKHLVKCNKCNHVFLPDYYNHVKIPGYDRPLEEVTKRNIHLLRWQEAKLLCPECGRDPEMHHTRMEFVCENSLEQHEANAWYVSPFSAHNLITVPYLVNTSTKFAKVSEFKNQSLGLTAEEADESITLADIEAAQSHADLSSSEFHVMGADMGLTCHIVIGRMATDGTYVVVHRERVHYTQFERRTAELAKEFRVILAVCDSQPYTDLVTRLAQARRNYWGAMFVTSRTTLAFTLQEQEGDETMGKMSLNLVKVNRTVALDELLYVIKTGKLAVQSSRENEDFAAQMQSLKRVQKFTKDNELQYVWEKTGEENDHYHFALLYFYIAVQMRGMVRTSGALAAHIPLITKFKNRNI